LESGEWRVGSGEGGGGGEGRGGAHRPIIKIKKKETRYIPKHSQVQNNLYSHMVPFPFLCTVIQSDGAAFGSQ